MTLLRHNGARTVALIVISALAFTVIAAAPAVGARGGAVAAKKCKKGKKSASAAKKGCKKKKKQQQKPPVLTPTPPQTTPPAPPPPTERASLTWDDEADLDLYVWDSSLNGGYAAGNFGGGSPIPSSTFPDDDTNGFGPETFLDQLSPSTRHFAFGVCMASSAAEADLSSTYTLTYRTGGGAVETDTDTLTGEFGDAVFYVPAGATDPDPAETFDWCDNGA